MLRPMQKSKQLEITCICHEKVKYMNLIRWHQLQNQDEKQSFLS